MALTHKKYYTIKLKGIEGMQFGQYDAELKAFRTTAGMILMKAVSSYSSEGFDPIDLMLQSERMKDLEQRVRTLERLLLLANTDKMAYEEAFRMYRNTNVMVDDQLL